MRDTSSPPHECPDRIKRYGPAPVAKYTQARRPPYNNLAYRPLQGLTQLPPLQAAPQRTEVTNEVVNALWLNNQADPYAYEPVSQTHPLNDARLQ